MNVAMCYNLYDIVTEFEAVFQIDGTDFEEKDVDTALRNIRTRIGRQYGFDMSTQKIFDPELEALSSRSSVGLFIDNVARLHSKLCGYTQVARYKTRNDVSLSDINYLGITESSLKTVLKAMQRERYLPSVADAMKVIKDKLQSISTCIEKRLFFLMVVAEDLGFYEVSAAIAEILYTALEATLR